MNAQTLLNMAVQLHQQGALEDAEKAYRLVLQLDPRNADALALLGSVLSETKRHEDALWSIEEALKLDPNAALFHFYYGNALDKAGYKARAESAFTKAIQFKPDWADAWYNLANAQRELNKASEAKAGYEKVLQLNPQHALAHNNLAVILLKEQNFSGARQHADNAHKLAPTNLQFLSTLNDVAFEQNDLPTAFASAQRYAELKLDLKDGTLEKILNEGIQSARPGAAMDEETTNCLLVLAVSHMLQGHLKLSHALLRLLTSYEPDMEEAYSLMGSIALARNKLDLADEAYAQSYMIDPSFTGSLWNRSMALLTQGKFKQGFACYRWRWHAMEKFKRMALKGPMWDGADLKGKTILVHEEQGFGDSLQMLRFMPELKKRGAKAWFYARPVLHKLIENWDGCDNVLEWANVDDKTLPQGVDIACGAMDLPGLLGVSPNTIPNQAPYLPNPKKDLPEYRLEGDGFKVGLVWSGNPLHKRDHERSIPLEKLSPLMNQKGVQYFSLQFKPKEADLKLMNEWGMVDLAPRIKNLADTAAFVSQLDLLITVDSAPAHLAGALGVKVWNLITLNPDWRWLLGREDSPWYPSLRLFRQSQMGQWDEVIQKVKGALSQQLAPN